jgi:FkbM family methyltransferase
MKEHRFPFNLAIQAGGSFGIWPHHLSRYFERVYTFEPEPTSFNSLCLNCKDFGNVFKIQAALGSANGTCKVIPKSATSHKVTAFGLFKNEKLTPMIKVDCLGLEFCDAIILDVEVYESFVVEGAQETIKHFRPAILLEVRQKVVCLDTKTLDLERFLKSNEYVKVLRHRGDDIYFPKERL